LAAAKGGRAKAKFRERSNGGNNLQINERMKILCEDKNESVNSYK
jgi:hypothetical protein